MNWWKRMKVRWDASVDRRIAEREAEELRIIQKYHHYPSSTLVKMWEHETDKRVKEELAFAVLHRREMGRE